MRVGSNQIKSEYRVVSDAIETPYQLFYFAKGLPLFEIALVLVRSDHLASVIVNADQASCERL